MSCFRNSYFDCIQKKNSFHLDANLLGIFVWNIIRLWCFPLNSMRMRSFVLFSNRTLVVAIQISRKLIADLNKTKLKNICITLQSETFLKHVRWQIDSLSNRFWPNPFWSGLFFFRLTPHTMIDINQREPFTPQWAYICAIAKPEIRFIEDATQCKCNSHTFGDDGSHCEYTKWPISNYVHLEHCSSCCFFNGIMLTFIGNENIN